MLREWYMHPNGQIPAYKWAFGDVNPPVHTWTSPYRDYLASSAGSSSRVSFCGFATA
jgi:hypothetical protein